MRLVTCGDQYPLTPQQLNDVKVLVELMTALVEHTLGPGAQTARIIGDTAAAEPAEEALDGRDTSLV